MSSVHPQRETQALIRRLHKDHEAERKLVLGASSRSAQAKSQRAEALVEAFTLQKKIAVVVPHCCSHFYLVCTRDFESGKYLIATVNRSSALFWYRLYTVRPVSRRVKADILYIYNIYI